MNEFRWQRRTVAIPPYDSNIGKFKNFLQSRELLNFIKHGSKEKDIWTEWADVPTVDENENPV